MTPRMEAIAYRLWAYAEPLGWNCTPGEAADAIGVPRNTVAALLRHKPKWADRFRVTEEKERAYLPSKPLGLVPGFMTCIQPDDYTPQRGGEE